MYKFSKISVIGLGYIGLPTAAIFASAGVEVIGIDNNHTVVDTLNRGDIHIIEPGLADSVAKSVAAGKLRASLTPVPAEAFLIAVPTPIDVENMQPDLTYVKAASYSIAPVLKKGDIVILESTSPVGTSLKMAEWLADARPDLSFPQSQADEPDVHIAFCPERVLPGKVMKELVENNRVIGGVTAKCSEMATALYRTFVTGDCIVTNSKTAEMVKLAENSYRDVNIAFANELSMICGRLDINVWDLIDLANQHPRVDILQPGSGVGGHCIAVDPWFIISRTPDLTKVIKAARQVNDMKPDWVVEQVKDLVSVFRKENQSKDSERISIACYGIAFKPDIDDLRESPSLGIVKKLSKNLAEEILVVEPNVGHNIPGVSNVELVDIDMAQRRADVHVVLVAHKEFVENSDKIARNHYIVDCCGFLKNYQQT